MQTHNMKTIQNTVLDIMRVKQKMDKIKDVTENRKTKYNMQKEESIFLDVVQKKKNILNGRIISSARFVGKGFNPPLAPLNPRFSLTPKKIVKYSQKYIADSADSGFTTNRVLIISQ